MAGYKDRTWCKSICVNTLCDRRLTQAVIDEAASRGYTIFAMSDFTEHCDEYKPPESLVEYVDDVEGLIDMEGIDEEL
jgi:hypothetical protein